MKVLVQWSKAQAEGWQEYDSAEWAGLPSKPVPAGGETMDNALGWVNTLNCQGVSFIGYDHYACEDLPGGVCRITSWKDDLDDAALDLTAGNVPPGLDPSQYGPADLLYARVWEFEPVAKYDGRQYNTRQRQTIYAGRAIRDFYIALGPVENTTIRPWDEFVPPSAALTRHGVWMPDDLMREHERAQLLHPWMEWAPEPVIPKGPEHHSITYLLNAPDTLDSDCLPAVDHNNKMDEAGQTSEDLSASFAGAQDKFAFAFMTQAGDPNSADWPVASGAVPWKFSFNSVAAGADIIYFIGNDNAFRRLSSACAVLEIWNHGEGAFSGTGVKVGTNTTFNPAAGAATDRFAIYCRAIRNASHGIQTLTLRTDASSFAQGPWAVGATISPSAIASAEAFGTAKEILTLPTVGGLASAEVFGSAREVLTLLAAGAIASGEAFGTAREILILLPSGLASGEAIGSHTVQTGAVIISPTGIVSQEAFGTHKQLFLVTLVGITSSEAFGTAKQILALLGVGAIPSGETFGSHRQTFLVSGLTGIGSAEIFGVGKLVFIIRPAGLASGEVFGPVTVQGGEPAAFRAAKCFFRRRR